MRTSTCHVPGSECGPASSRHDTRAISRCPAKPTAPPTCRDAMTELPRCPRTAMTCALRAAVSRPAQVVQLDAGATPVLDVRGRGRIARLRLGPSCTPPRCGTLTKRDIRREAETVRATPCRLNTQRAPMTPPPPAPARSSRQPPQVSPPRTAPSSTRNGGRRTALDRYDASRSRCRAAKALRTAPRGICAPGASPGARRPADAQARDARIARIGARAHERREVLLRPSARRTGGRGGPERFAVLGAVQKVSVRAKRREAATPAPPGRARPRAPVEADRNPRA